MNTYNHIKQYISFLQKSFSLSITIHHMSSRKYEIEKYAEYNLHTNPYCLYLKTNPALWNKCVYSQDPIPQKCNERGSFFGMCHAGVCEYVYPIDPEDPKGGFISVSGYRPKSDDALYEKAKHKIKKLCVEFSLDEQAVLNIYHDSLSKRIPNKKLVDTLIEPLCDLIRLASLESAFQRDDITIAKPTTKEKNYYQICHFIRRHHNEKISLETICHRLNYSPSYVSHLFKSQSGKTINQYINDLRIAEAKTLLKNTTLSIQEISNLIGFNDSNYFTNVFRNKIGYAPSEYRKRKKDG